LVVIDRAEAVISEPAQTRVYECDALSAYRCPPLAAVLPASTAEVAAILKICHEEGVPVVPRGSGTSLAGGALPTADSVILGVSKLADVLETDYDNRYIRVQTGRTNLSVTGAVEQDDFFYAPDPSSQLACAIAGNIAMNSGGAHCLKYGVTTNNLLGVTMVTMQGEIIELGGAHLDAAGYDWLGIICGSEGQLGVVTEATLRILRKPEGARPVLIGYDSNETAGACVADIIRAGVESMLIWKGRKSAFGAMGQISDYICLDGTIPVSELPYTLKRIGELSEQYGLKVANVFHAGDGNMHPLILFDANKPGDLETCEALGAEILTLCVEVGGCLSGEHGVGVEKRDLMTAQYTDEDLEIQMQVKDVFDPAWLLNPAKVFPLASSDSRRRGDAAARPAAA